MTPRSVPFTGTLVDARKAPAETLRLVSECAATLRSEGKSWADFYANAGRRKVEDGSYLGVLWISPGGDAIASVAWEVSGELGRRGGIYLAEGYQRRSVLEAFLDRLESETATELPFISWAGDVPGVPDDQCAAVFQGRGYVSVVRADMRFPKRIPLTPTASSPSVTLRNLTFSDEADIADLLFRVYADDPLERALFATTSDQREGARRGTHGLLHGEVGRWIPEASFGIFDGGRLVAQTLANELGGGLITEVGVDPSFRRRGFARRLLPFTIRALRAAGFEEPRLVVTMRNERAVRLYLSLGFEFVPGGDGRMWLNSRALGLAPATP